MKTYYDSFVLCKSNHNTYIIPHTVMKSRYTNVKYHCEISWYFSVHCLPQSLRNYKEEAKIKPSEKALAMPGQQDYLVFALLGASGCLKYIKWKYMECRPVSWWRHQMGTFSAFLVLYLGESIDHRWFLLTKASGAELWCFLWYTHEHMVEQTIDMPMIRDAITFVMTSLFLYSFM